VLVWIAMPMVLSVNPARDSNVLRVTAETDTASLSPANNRLAEMRKRATYLKSCIAEQPPSTFKAEVLGPAAYGGGMTCAPVNLTFVHIFKAAGQTVATAFGDLCESRFGRFAVKKWDIEAFSSYPRGTLFTFARDPETRFLSASKELAMRYTLLEGIKSASGTTAWQRARDAILREDVDALAAQVLDSVDAISAPMEVAASRGTDVPIPNWRHLDRQAAFLMQYRHTKMSTTPRALSHAHHAILPDLGYVGRVESLEEDFRALMAHFFGPAGKSYNLTTKGDSTDSDYQDQRADPDKAAWVLNEQALSLLQTSQISNATRAAILAAYSWDVSCFAR